MNKLEILKLKIIKRRLMKYNLQLLSQGYYANIANVKEIVNFGEGKINNGKNHVKNVVFWNNGMISSNNFYYKNNLWNHGNYQKRMNIRRKGRIN